MIFFLRSVFLEMVNGCYLILHCVLFLLLSCSSESVSELDAINISNTPGRSEHPAIAAGPSGDLYVVWDDNFVNEESLVVYLVSRPPGGNWSEPVKIFEPEAARVPDIEVGMPNTLYLVWQNTNPLGESEILFSQRPQSSGWSAPETISVYGMSTLPQMAVDNNGSIHLIWKEISGDWPIYYIWKPDGGAWSLPIEISRGSVFGRYHHQISVDLQGHAHVVWEETMTDTGPSYIVYTTNALGGSWSDPQAIHPFGPSYEPQLNPSIIVDNNDRVHVVWAQYADIYYTLRDVGQSWETPVRICSTATLSSWPALTADSDGSVHMVWVETNTKLYYSVRHFDDWIEPTIYEVNETFYSPPRVAVSSGKIGVVFCANVLVSPQAERNYEILFLEFLKE